METVSHYGLHTDKDNVIWLEQGRAGVNALGLKRRSPFRVELASKKRHCNHQINLAQPVPNDSHWNYLMDIATDPLGEAVLPIPKLDAGIYYVEQKPRTLDIVTTLAGLSCPIHNSVVPIWVAGNRQSLVEELASTNLQPLVITECEPKHSALLGDLALAATYNPRKLIILGNDVVVPPQAQRLETQLDDPDYVQMENFKALPWAALGSVLVKKHMRGDLHLRRPLKLGK